MIESGTSKEPTSAFESPTFGQNASFDLDKPVGSASISPCGRDVVLASRQGLHIIDLDSPYSPPRHLPHHTPWEVADVQWSPFAARDYWVVSTSNQKALVWNLTAMTRSSVEHVLHAHTRAITDVNFSAHNPDILATCAVDSSVHCWDLRHPSRPAMTFCDWFAAATQVKWNRQDPHILASSHDKYLRIWDDRKGAYPLRSIEAHATKIYGVDWSRTETSCLVTCSLDCTIKFWDYSKDLDEPGQVLNTPFPVWRARHTPFGCGLLAMPQRGDHDLHLYDSRLDENDSGDQDQGHSLTFKFGGHHNQVKEFLWRSRGTVSEDFDQRDFQLVSWGTDRVLCLHQVEDDVLRRVGYEKGMRVKRQMNFTRRNATYKTFRDDPGAIVQKDPDYSSGTSKHQENEPFHGTQSTPTAAISRATIPFIGGYGIGGFMSPAVKSTSKVAKDADPISWMRGVKIGKRETSPSGLHHSVSSVLSPRLKLYPAWDVFDSLGEEITHVGDKFKKVSFDEVDMQRRKILVSLTGPWGLDKSPTYAKVSVEFPLKYPDAMLPNVVLDKTAAIGPETIAQVNSDLAEITTKFLSHQRSSLEAILRYLLGEQNLEGSLSWLRERQRSIEIDSMVEIDSSSSEEDDDALAVSKNDLDSSESMIAKPRVQNNLPLPKACGASWADNGLLVCFFPTKPDKESLFDITLKAGERSSRGRKSIFEGFGRFGYLAKGKRRTASTLETIESGDSSDDESSPSSDSSSSTSDDVGLSNHHFLPNMAWRGDASEVLHGATLDESQKSNTGAEISRSLPSRDKTFVSIQDHSEFLPSKEHLAQNYVLGNRLGACLHNASIAQQSGDADLADVWLFADLILQNKVPLEVMRLNGGFETAQNIDMSKTGSVLLIARCALSTPEFEDSGVDLSFDKPDDEQPFSFQAPIRWGHHPFGRRYLIEALFHHYEKLADVQMLAMLSCLFSENRDTRIDLRKGSTQVNDINHFRGKRNSFPEANFAQSYYPSKRIARTDLYEMFPPIPALEEYQNTIPGQTFLDSSVGVAISDGSASTTPPSTRRPLSTTWERRESFATSLSTSPEHIRYAHRSSPNLSALESTAASSSSSSPPTQFPKRYLSPTGSYLGVSTSTNSWNRSHMFGRSSSTITEEPKSSFTLSISDTDEDAPLVTNIPVFNTSLKNQGLFHNDGYNDTSLLDVQQGWRYRAYQEAYAHLLYVWDLPIKRMELLAYRDDVLRAKSSSTYDLRSPRDPAKPTPSYDLGFRNKCTTCQTSLSIESGSWHCTHCAKAQAAMICLLCSTITQGLSSPCLNCGHTLHSSCRELLISPGANDAPVECISGCGCICTEYISVQLEQVVNLAEPDVSPARTIIEDTAAHEKEQSSWYDNTEWEDMAYESLARNLRPRKEVKPKGSQIWRRRKAST